VVVGQRILVSDQPWHKLSLDDALHDGIGGGGGRLDGRRGKSSPMIRRYISRLIHGFFGVGDASGDKNK
jgi:hypothetical protein